MKNNNAKTKREYRSLEWNNEQCEVVINNIRKFQGNITHSFEKSASELGVSYHVIRNEWYSKKSRIKVYLETTKTPCLFFAYMDGSLFGNRKNIFVKEIEE